MPVTITIFDELVCRIDTACYSDDVLESQNTARAVFALIDIAQDERRRLMREIAEAFDVPPGVVVPGAASPNFSIGTDGALTQLIPEDFPEGPVVSGGVSLCGEFWPGQNEDTPASRQVRCDRPRGHDGRHLDSRYPERVAID